MKIIKWCFTNGYPGGDLEGCDIFPSTYTDDQINENIREDFWSYCADYAYLAFGYPWEDLDDGDFEDLDEMYDAEDDYYANCGYEFKEITVEELKEWCEGHYNEFDEVYAPLLKSIK